MLTVKQKQFADAIVDAHFEVEHFGTGKDKVGKAQTINKVRDKIIDVLKDEPAFDEVEFRSYIQKTLIRKNKQKAEADAERKV